jgi:hypothetical protein
MAGKGKRLTVMTPDAAIAIPQDGQCHDFDPLSPGFPK